MRKNSGRFVRAAAREQKTAYGGIMTRDLTQGNVRGALLLFSLPIMAGNLLQQMYNVADTLIVSHYLGPDALAAVGSAGSLMVLLTSILLGLCMGSGVVFSQLFGAGQHQRLRRGVCNAFLLVALLAVALSAASYAFLRPILQWLNTPPEALADTEAYLRVILAGLLATFVYNFLAAVLRAIGNSLVPLLITAGAAVLNIVLDLWFVLGLGRGVGGAAEATVISQAASALAVAVYYWAKAPFLRPRRQDWRLDGELVRRLAQSSVLTSLQQSVMNFGILMVQGLVNSFGVAVMAAYTAAGKVNSFALMPATDFGNGFGTFIAQNAGARKPGRIREGIRQGIFISGCFCLAISAAVWVGAPWLMQLFIDAKESAIIATGVQYLRIEGACYVGIGVLTLLYGLYCGLERAQMSILLSMVSLGTRVGLAYLLAPIPAIGLPGIWWAVPIGWFLADAVGLAYFARRRQKLLPWGAER